MTFWKHMVKVVAWVFAAFLMAIALTAVGLETTPERMIAILALALVLGKE